MTNLSFTEHDGIYTAEFVMRGPTALHIERDKPSPLSLEQRSGSEGEYVKVEGWGDYYAVEIDTDLVAEVYPKYIYVESHTPVTRAYIVEG